MGKWPKMDSLKPRRLSTDQISILSKMELDLKNYAAPLGPEMPYSQEVSVQKNSYWKLISQLPSPTTTAQKSYFRHILFKT